jgi:hypothetical protein
MKSRYKRIAHNILVLLLVFVFSLLLQSCFGPINIDKDINVKIAEDFSKIAIPVAYELNFASKPRTLMVRGKPHLFSIEYMDSPVAFETAIKNTIHAIFESPEKLACSSERFCVQLSEIHEVESFDCQDGVCIKIYAYHSTLKVLSPQGDIILTREISGEATSAEFDEDVKHKFLIELAITRFGQKLANTLLGINWHNYS